MRYSILLSIVLLFSSCVVRDNPMDAKGDSFEKPSIASSSGIPANGVLVANELRYSITGNTEHTVFRCKLDDNSWSNWVKKEYTTAIPTGHHSLVSQLCYPSMTDTVSSMVQFSSLAEESSFYLSPAFVSAENCTVTLNSHAVSDNATSLHFVLKKGTVSSAQLEGDTSFTELLYADSTLDIAVFPGGAAITGDRAVVSMTVTGLVSGDTLEYSTHLENKNGDTVTIKTTLGTIVQ